MKIDRLMMMRGIRNVALFFVTIIVALGPTPLMVTAKAATDSVEIWWPTNGTVMTGSSPVKGILANHALSEYTMTWNVNNGKENAMSDSQAEYPHKESTIDFSGWTWDGSGPYTMTLIARNMSGTEFARTSVKIYTSGTQSAPTTSVPPATSTNTAPVTDTASLSPAPRSTTISVWWPTDSTHVSGITPLKAVVDGADVSTYTMYYQVDDGAKNAMPTNTADWPHKEAAADTATWAGTTNQHTLTFTASDTSGSQIATKNIVVYSDTQSATTAPALPVTQVPSTSGQNPLAGATFFTGTYSPAADQVTAWMSSRPTDAVLIKKLVGVQDARWFGDWNSNVTSDVNTYVGAAAAAGALPVIVAYNIPARDCGGYSSGGANSATTYKTWIQAFAKGIGSKKAVVVVEPDAIAGMDCLSPADQATRLDLLNFAVATLKKNSGATVYLDAGHSNWHPAADIAARLQKANITAADGFSLNVSNYYATPELETFGGAVSTALGGKHYIIDTSRNGNGSNGEWCNAQGRALGNYPTSSTGNPLVDAFLWIKKPGESDGYCNGGPAAGAWWGDYALGLIKNSLN